MKHGFIRAAAATPLIHVADCAANAAEAIALAAAAEKDGVKLLVFPELCLTSYSSGELFLSQLLIDGALDALRRYLRETASLDLLSIVGLPVAHCGKLYNCAAVCSHGTLLGLVPKSAIPNYGEFYEARWFTPAPAENETYLFDGVEIPFGTKLIFSCTELPDLRVAVEICEDLWTPVPPTTMAAAAGAAVLCNLSASSETVGKEDYRRMLVLSHSARTFSGYVYASSGRGESTTDAVYSGHVMVAECGVMLAERKPFSEDSRLYSASEIDLGRVTAERRRAHTFAAMKVSGYREIPFSLKAEQTVLTRKFDPHPFVPDDKGELSRRSETVLEIQARGLAQRVTAACARCCVVGVSGGLDSCLALLVSARAMDLLGRPRTDVIGVTMPCFGTTKRTRSNAELLCDELGVTFREINIADAVTVHFRDIGHDPSDHNVVYENAQARERTRVLMDLANAGAGMVVGTGDLSELALGWATYNGDHMSMYGVNASVPKTLVRHIVAHCAEKAEEQGKSALSQILRDILATPVSPELIPADRDGEIAQKTEDIVGPYELHDFFLYYMLRFGYSPDKLYRMACIAFDGCYDEGVIKLWLNTFMRRFFSQQFKRSCLPDGPKVGSVSLSPRGDWRMPSDVCAAAWIAEAQGVGE